MNLRPYQEKAISDLKIAVKNGSKAPLLVMPTGSGKTVVFSQIAKNCLSKEKKVLILVHRKELIDQASKKLANINVEHGIIAANYKGKKADIQIASVQTLVRRLQTTIFDPNLGTANSSANKRIVGLVNNIVGDNVYPSCSISRAIYIA